ELPDVAQSSVVLAADGTPILTLHAEENRSNAAYGDIPAHLVDAVVAIEDERLGHHRGLDLRARVLARHVASTERPAARGAPALPPRPPSPGSSRSATQRSGSSSSTSTRSTSAQAPTGWWPPPTSSSASPWPSSPSPSRRCWPASSTRRAATTCATARSRRS